MEDIHVRLLILFRFLPSELLSLKRSYFEEQHSSTLMLPLCEVWWNSWNISSESFAFVLIHFLYVADSVLDIWLCLTAIEIMLFRGHQTRDIITRVSWWNYALSSFSFWVDGIREPMLIPRRHYWAPTRLHASSVCITPCLICAMRWWKVVSIDHVFCVSHWRHRHWRRAFWYFLDSRPLVSLILAFVW